MSVDSIVVCLIIIIKIIYQLLDHNFLDYTGYLVASFVRTKKLIAIQMNLKWNTILCKGKNFYINIIFPLYMLFCIMTYFVICYVLYI